MRIATLLATAAALTASAALAQATPQTTPPTTAAPQSGTTPDSTMPSTDAPASTSTTPAPGDTTTPDTGSAPAAPAAAVITTTATTLVQPAVGVDVLDAAGAKAGTIKALDNQFVTITTAKGDVRLAKASIGPGPNGAVIGGTAAELETAAARAATPAAPARRAPRRR